MTVVCVAGMDVREEYYAYIEEQAPATESGFRDNRLLVEAQKSLCRAEFCEAEIVKSMYGYSVRYASGLNNFALIRKSSDLGGTLVDALTFVKEWQSQDPKRRFVTAVLNDEEQKIVSDTNI